jgi:hypothetical protein
MDLTHAIDGNRDLDGALEPPWLSGGPLCRLRQHVLLHESDAADESTARDMLVSHSFRSIYAANPMTETNNDTEPSTHRTMLA